MDLDKIEIGDTIPLTEGTKAIDIAIEAAESARAAFSAAARMVKDTDRELWAIIHELHPELDGWELGCDWKKMEIVIMRRKRLDDC